MGCSSLMYSRSRSEGLRATCIVLQDSRQLHDVILPIVKTVVLVGLIGMDKTGCSGETRLVLHVRVMIIIVVIITAGSIVHPDHEYVGRLCHVS